MPKIHARIAGSPAATPGGFLSEPKKNQMKPGIPALRLLSLAGLFALSAPALAIDCRKAATDVEKLICSDRGAVSADAELNRNYGALLKQAPDAEIRAMLVDSQKRWLAARDRALETLIGYPDSLPDGKTPARAARELILDRSAQFKEAEKGASTPRMIARALEQRQFQSRFTGGPLAGYSTSCDVLPPDYGSYGCFAIRHYQNKDRVCSIDESWASGGVYTHRYVANVVDGKPKVIASCSFNNADEACSDDAGKTRWNRTPAQPEHVYSATPLPKIDGEVYDQDDYAWAQACLADPAYPAGN